jgi:3-octaprenyl-4-hydroxybenzoate carboxy-lyase
MGDWCGPEIRHRLIENRGALIRDHQSRELIKENKEILTGTSVPLDTCLLMGDPGKKTDILVPAHAEIVIEGEVTTTAYEPEAPFGEAAGFIAPGIMHPFFDVKLSRIAEIPFS